MTSSLCFGRLIKPSTPNCFSWLKTEVQVSAVICPPCMAFFSEQNGNSKFHLQPLQNESGRWFSYQLQWPQKVFINTKAKKQHPDAPSLCCGASMARAGQRGTSYLSWNKTLMDFVLWLGKRDGPKCPAGRVKVTFCLDASTCVTGESVWLLKG